MAKKERGVSVQVSRVSGVAVLRASEVVFQSDAGVEAFRVPRGAPELPELLAVLSRDGLDAACARARGKGVGASRAA